MKNYKVSKELFNLINSLAIYSSTCYSDKEISYKLNNLPMNKAVEGYSIMNSVKLSVIKNETIDEDTLINFRKGMFSMLEDYDGPMNSWIKNNVIDKFYIIINSIDKALFYDGDENIELI